MYTCPLTGIVTYLSFSNVTLKCFRGIQTFYFTYVKEREKIHKLTAIQIRHKNGTG